MKKMIIPIITLFLTFVIGFGSISFAGPPQGAPGLANTTQMESFSGAITYGDEELILDFGEVRHISLSLYWGSHEDTYVSMHSSIGDLTTCWYGPFCQFTLLEGFTKEEIDTNHLTIDVVQFGGSGTTGTLYYNITTTYPAAP